MSRDDNQLRVRLTGHAAADTITVPADSTAHDELVRFLNRQGPYAQIWIRLASGEYVRYESIESVALAPGDEPGTSK